MEIITGYRARNNIYIRDGFQYIRSSRSRGRVYFRCALPTCHARANLNGEQFNISREHNHGQQQHEISIRRFRQDLRESARTSRLPLRQSFDTVSDRHREVAPYIGYPRVRTMMQNERRRATPETPQSLRHLADIIQRDEWAQFRESLDGRPFYHTYLAEEGVEPFEVLMFISPGLRPELNRTSRIHIDATFKVVPRHLGYQLLTIHAEIEQHMFPVVYVLMSRKTEAAYLRIFRELLDHICPDSARTVRLVMSDFELGIMNAAARAWPNASIKGCWFHFAQAVYKKHLKLHLRPITANNGAARRALKMSMALALLPSVLMEAGVRAIEAFLETNVLDEAFLDFIQYIRDFWLRVIGADRVSVHRLLHRTNNALEGFYSALKSRMGTHTRAWTFIDHLRTVDSANTLDSLRLARGEAITKPRRWRWVRQDASLTRAWDDLENAMAQDVAIQIDPEIIVMEFLQRVSHNVEGLERRLGVAVGHGMQNAAAPQADGLNALEPLHGVESDSEGSSSGSEDDPGFPEQPVQVAYLHAEAPEPQPGPEHPPQPEPQDPGVLDQPDNQPDDPPAPVQYVGQPQVAVPELIVDGGLHHFVPGPAVQPPPVIPEGMHQVVQLPIYVLPGMAQIMPQPPAAVAGIPPVIHEGLGIPAMFGAMPLQFAFAPQGFVQGGDMDLADPHIHPH